MPNINAKTLLIIGLMFLGTLPKAFCLELKEGDILLQPLSCWSCHLIMQQENSDFAHMGMVIKEDGELKVFEALGEVRVISLNDFIKRTSKGKRVLVRRLSADYKFFPNEEFYIEIGKFKNLSYDHGFRWDNFDKKGEKIYCSELVFKILSPLGFLTYTETKIMDFDINPQLWDRYFKGETPRGEYGISPEDFNLSKDFETVGEL